jgi:8-oxo-dGTP pyrophosphatase MutT (NUDIX family)
MDQRIDVTVAAVIEWDERFLIVEERAGGQIVLNQPAGHLEPGESLVDAVVRETLEETGFEFRPSSLVGIYLWHSLEAGTTFLRATFCGTARAPRLAPPLDDVIIDVHWLKRSQVLSREHDLRSPLVMRCIDDYLAGVRYPLDCLTHLQPSVQAREASPPASHRAGKAGVL